jgi:hypothetical protein
VKVTDEMCEAAWRALVEDCGRPVHAGDMRAALEAALADVSGSDCGCPELGEELAKTIRGSHAGGSRAIAPEAKLAKVRELARQFPQVGRNQLNAILDKE